MFQHTRRSKFYGIFLAIGVVFSFAWSASAQSGYTYTRAITIDHTKVPNTDQANFPFLFNTTDPLLKSAGNGGHVTSASGYDIVFTSDSAGTQKLDHEIESYTACTGQFIAWVRIPTLSHTSDTPIYLQYGKSSITTSQENRAAVWDGNYKVVWHLPTVATINDSTSNGNNGTNSGTTATAGKIGGGSNNTGANETYISVPVPGSGIYDPSQITYSAWINPSALTNQDGDSYMVIVTIGGKGFAVESNGTLQTDTSTSGSYKQSISTNTVLTNVWQYVTAVSSASDNLWHLYLNGVETGYSSQGPGNGTIQSDSGPLYVGSSGNVWSGNFNGSFDEVRVSNIARSADWIKAEYNNQNAPSAFYSLGPEPPSGVPITITSLPTGLALTVDAQACASTPCAYNWTPGSSHTIAVASTTQAGAAGTQYVFANWSDSGAASHTVAGPASTTTYTANFTTQYQLTTVASPTAGGTIGPASGWYNSGTVSVSATANAGYTFSGFNGALTGTTTPQNLTLTAPATVTATFVAMPLITLTSSPTGLALTVDG